MRRVYQRYPICAEVPHKLSWTHLCELVEIDDPLERSFYKKQGLPYIAHPWFVGINLDILWQNSFVLRSSWYFVSTRLPLAR
ncbi:hypothetical protein [Paraflavisolibacter sp. H34]|uniref:hypothetical protein n=1 Tax=Huijunlia imazamoxiresistens TaxID=3127457 RepID=UPI0039C9AF6D